MIYSATKQQGEMTMTRFERDYKDALDGDGVGVLKNRQKELQQLRNKLDYCKNEFRAQCLLQEIARLEKEYRQIDELF